MRVAAFTFESLLYLPKLAWALKTGRDDYHYYPEVWAETFSNPDGWQDITPIKDRLKHKASSLQSLPGYFGGTSPDAKPVL